MCHNLQLPRNQMFKGIAERRKGA
ncbi:hypothetical protein V5094_15365 [Moellerella wisconsensis]|uniref:Transposase n=2 Tax=Moellerella wisconsensis TaxID=158849 RepID=A0ACD3YCD6_9GAMM|nr:transposase [Moellerella wisconsensis]UNH25771.1 transposase [Moellerella wisconsensis]UNH28899.1 transposase [Moellerella wisconsensis]UNH32363.1 transposase [Moellerella wisconsensis]UNH40534.1 transposase [Moellerella wisconsensis]UNH44018.1 transposase [Moellerella wisconsensis]